MDKTKLGNKIKTIEKLGNYKSIPGIPLIIRLDGHNFSKFSKGLGKPYDIRLSNLMRDLTKYLMVETNARIGYTQSDEITLLLYSNNDSQIYFDGKISKIESILAAKASVYFYSKLEEYLPKKKDKLIAFDCRARNFSKYWAIRNILWRERDAVKNSIQSLARCYFSHTQMYKKNGKELQEMLMIEYDINWNDLPLFFKRGSYFVRYPIISKFSSEEFDNLPEKHNARKNPDLEFKRTVFFELYDKSIITIPNIKDKLFNNITFS